MRNKSKILKYGAHWTGKNKKSEMMTRGLWPQTYIYIYIWTYRIDIYTLADVEWVNRNEFWNVHQDAFVSLRGRMENGAPISLPLAFSRDGTGGLIYIHLCSATSDKNIKNIGRDGSVNWSAWLITVSINYAHFARFSGH